MQHLYFLQGLTGNPLEITTVLGRARFQTLPFLARFIIAQFAARRQVIA